MKDSGLGPLSKLVWRAKLAQKHAVPDAPSPSEAGERVNPISTGKTGRDIHLWTRVGFCVTMGQKLRNVPSNSLFQGIDEALSAIKS